MNPLIGLVGGLIAGLALVRFAGGQDAKRARRVYAIGLVVAALVYVAFAVAGGATGSWLAAEVAGVVVFGVTAWAASRSWPLLLALGWLAHIAWDVLLHLDGSGAAYTPRWYPWLCVSFDLVVAGAVVAQSRRAAEVGTASDSPLSRPPAPH